MRAVLAILLLVAVVAQARIRLVCPTPVPGGDDENQQPSQASPCGADVNMADSTIVFTPLAPGQQSILFLETVDIEDSPFSLRLCTRAGDCSYVLLDHIPHLNLGNTVNSAPASRFENRPFSLAFTMPNIQCAECFLQLIQVGREAYISNQDCTFAAAQVGTCSGKGNVQYVACAPISINGTTTFRSNPGNNANGLDYSNNPGDWQFSNENRGAGQYRQFAGNNAGWDWPTNERNTIVYGYRANNVPQKYRTPSGTCSRMFTTAEVNFKSAFYNAASFTPSGGKAAPASALSSGVAVVLAAFAALAALLL